MIEIDIEQLKKDLYHRGPDHFGHDILNNYLICNARLKVQDLNAGYQPFVSDNKKYALVYNGELYNKDYIKGLLTQSYDFKSHSDTEIIFYSLIEHGIGIIEKFNGMFALCFIDLEKNELFLARDRFGVKPLYFFKDGHDFSFASEMRALKNIIPYKNLNLSAIKSYLQTNYIHDDNAIYEQCEILKPGEFIKLDMSNFKLTRHKYWDLKITETHDFDPNTLDSLLDQAVKRQLISDRKVGVYLSSGIDSSTMAYYASKHLGEVDAYTIGFNHKDFDESPIAEKVAKKLNLNFHRYEFSQEDFINTLNEYSTYTSSPIADLGMYPLYFLSRYVVESSTVLLSGDGGDEIFGGYPTIKGFIASLSLQESFKTWAFSL
jgi:asparagine synthase (glutamine-hydrolysing)